MKILFVAMPFSVHTSRWLNQLAGQGWDLHLYSSMPYQSLHPEIRGISYHQNFYEQQGAELPGNRYSSPKLSAFASVKGEWARRFFRLYMRVRHPRHTRAQELAQLIEQLEPDILHSMETQHAGYLVNETKKIITGKFPYWIHSTWGIDLDFFGQLSEHQQTIRETLGGVDELIVEGKRDAELARQFGYESKLVCIPSVGGGFKIQEQSLGRPSARKKILIKGTQDLVRRGLFALRALERCSDLLAGYELILYSANETTGAAAQLFEKNTGLAVRILENSTQEAMLQHNAEARISLCMNKSDGVPNTMLEAMLMGAFPIQSNTSMANEWIDDGVTGLLTHPEDVDTIANAIRRALSDDELVDAAALKNRALIEERLGYEKINKRILEMYTSSSIGSRQARKLPG